MRFARALVISAAVLCSPAAGQDSTAAALTSDSVTASTTKPAPAAAVLTPSVVQYSYDAMPKDPLASCVFSATFPGMGQLYNREYLRGVATGVLFWGTFFLAQWELYRWQELNTDTFYVAEYEKNGDTFEPTGDFHSATALKPESQQVGLPTGEKVVLGASIAVAAASYVFGIIDSYQGAKRYNRRILFQKAAGQPGLSLSASPFDKRVAVTATAAF